ncbi:MAG: tryptophan 7-halogenase [Acidobacteria bacterium]|nr:tryptophan 7-halogenase [Acidobacteriota bacterium]
MRTDFDLAVIGSGFSASLLAMIARRLGLTVVIIERGMHPRFAIGESTSPLMNLIIEQLAERYDLPRLIPLTTYGAWQNHYPDIVCGLKRGFTYFRHEPVKEFRVAHDRANQLMVAASPNNEVADTHWLRADVDHFLLNEALDLGADYMDRTMLNQVDLGDEKMSQLSGERNGQEFCMRARILIDASGPNGFLNRKLNLAGDFDDYPQTQSLYSHFTGVHRCDRMPEYEVDETPPYSMDDAALHHVFDGGWMWVLRFGNGVTSAGIAVTEALAAELKLSDGEAAWRRFLSRYPSIAAQFTDAEAIREFTWIPRLASRASSATGPGWALLPSAAAFVDPLFSTGMPLALLGVERIAAILEDGLHDDHRLSEYGRTTLVEADHTASFIASCYSSFPRFEHFAAYSMFYFAAASYSEMARRLGCHHLVRRFLAADRQPFAAGMLELGQMLRQSLGTSSATFAAQVKDVIEPLNIAGLCDPGKRNWYGVDLNDVIAGAEKLGKTSTEMITILQNAVWAK